MNLQMPDGRNKKFYVYDTIYLFIYITKTYIGTHIHVPIVYFYTVYSPNNGEILYFENTLFLLKLVCVSKKS